MNDEPCKLHSLIYLLRGSDACCNNKNNHSKLGSRSPYTHCVYKCASANESLHRHNGSRHTFGHYKNSISIYWAIRCLRHGRSYCRDCQRRAYSFLAAESLFFLASLLSSQPILDSRVSFVCVSILLLSLGVGKRHIMDSFLGSYRYTTCTALLHVKTHVILSTS